MIPYSLTHLDMLESESIHIMREVAAEFEKPILLFSGGKDSICMLRLAEKAFRPAKIPFPFLHIDTGHNFPELIEFRDRTVTLGPGELVVVAFAVGFFIRGFVTDSGSDQTTTIEQQVPGTTGGQVALPSPGSATCSRTRHRWRWGCSRATCAKWPTVLSP